ncbi:hypothetical protein EBR04_06200, partial [bacterium]|nr:hypothetical protein [bacterium]
QLGSTDTQEAREALATAIVTAPAALQQPLAISLASTTAGADLLLERVATGKASTRLLQDKSVVDRLKASGAADVEERIAAADIGEAAVSHLSPMASNMLDQIGEKNLPDLLAYLMQQAARP